MRLVGAVLSTLFVAAAAQLPPITIDYPSDGSIFPPDIAAPTFIWRDSAESAGAWRIDIAFASGRPGLRIAAPGERMRVGEIDPRCIAETNELPKLTREQETARTWTPDEKTWSVIKQASTERPATITITGFAQDRPVSRGRIAISASNDPVSAPIFFRDVPLMPAELQRGVIKPLPKNALPLVAWRLRYVNETQSRTLVENLPTCANCHSFSRDGKTLGMDLDGPANDKGLYALVPIERVTNIRKQDVIAWSSFRGRLAGETRVGFMSQVSPDGQYVVTMVRGLGAAPAGAQKLNLPKTVNNFYVANFKDYRFLQVFYPTRGMLAWYSRATGVLQPLPGADDPRYVHTNAVWSPDGKYLVFARAEARDAYPEGARPAEAANDPYETPMRYDLYRIPFNEGRGGRPEAIRGASANRMSNSFPKFSPDGRWIVFVQARNGLLMRPDSRLYIVPAAGGQARPLRSNTPLMNSWHSFSPNGRWLVFSSKSRSPYTQMFLTHIDEQGNDSPAILIENATAANRAVNIPEFVNIGPDAWAKIEAPATEFYRVSDVALELLQKGRYEESIAEWRKALQMEPRDTAALSNLAAALDVTGRFEEAEVELRKALESDPENYKTHGNLGVLLGKTGRLEEARASIEKALELGPDDALLESSLAGVLMNSGRPEEAAAHARRALEIDPVNSDAHNTMGSLYARAGKFDDAVRHFERALQAEPNSFVLHYNLGRAQAAQGRVDEGIRHLERAAELSRGQAAVVLDKLAAMYADRGRFRDALSTARRALELATGQNERELIEGLTARIPEYESRAQSQR